MQPVPVQVSSAFSVECCPVEAFFLGPPKNSKRPEWQERLKISERTVAGLERARKQGRVGGRPRLVLDRDRVRRLRNEGKSLREISDQMGLSQTTTARIVKTA